MQPHLFNEVCPFALSLELEDLWLECEVEVGVLTRACITLRVALWDLRRVWGILIQVIQIRSSKSREVIQ